MSDETEDSQSLAAQRLRHQRYLEELETAAMDAVRMDDDDPDSVATMAMDPVRVDDDPDSVATVAMDAVRMDDDPDSGATVAMDPVRVDDDPDSVATAAMDPVRVDDETDATEVHQATAPGSTEIVGEVTPPTVVRTSARELPVDKPTPARIPPPAKPIRRVRTVAPRTNESATMALPIAEQPVAIPPSIVPPRPANSNLTDLVTIADAAAIAPNRLPWESPEISQPQSDAFAPVNTGSQPIIEPEYARSRRKLLWLWYLLILATTAAVGWNLWMWFARDELNPPPPSEVVESQILGPAGIRYHDFGRIGILSQTAAFRSIEWDVI